MAQRTGRPRLSVGHSAAGFTLVELLVVIAVAVLLALMAVQAFTRYLPRYQLRGAVTQVAQQISRARLESVKRGVTTVLMADFTDRTMTLYAEINGDPANPLAAGQLYLVFDPDPLQPPDRTDYLIATFPLPGSPGAGIQFGGPVDGINGADAVDGFTPVPGAPPGTPPVLVMSPTGAVQNPGAFRLTDAGGSNILEAAITNFSGKVEIRKYLYDVDSPTTTAGFFAEGNKVFDGNKVGETIWAWYD